MEKNRPASPAVGVISVELGSEPREGVLGGEILQNENKLRRWAFSNNMSSAQPEIIKS